MKLAKTVLGLVLALGCAQFASAQGQDPIKVPDILRVDITVIPRGDIVGAPLDLTKPPLEASTIVLDVYVRNTASEEYYLRKRSTWVPYQNYFSPQPPPTEGDSGTFVKINNPIVISNSEVLLKMTYTLPEVSGPNQARLRDLINYDVFWKVQLESSNDAEPQGEEGQPLPVGIWVFDLSMLDDPALNGPNPPPQANAGPDQTVAVNTTVTLDGGDSFDGSNVGFDPFDPDVIVKDKLTYTWEWLSGPVRVDPTYPDVVNRPAEAEATLNTAGTYVFRLSVTDGVNPLPSTDTVSVTAGPPPAPNNAPTAVIVGPTAPVVVGSLVTLDGNSGSFDPDGDALTYRWRQTDELGGTINEGDLQSQFQPLSGLQAPIATWQAIVTGKYYFRLLVSDGELSSSATITVEVISAAQAGARVSNDSAASGVNSPSDSSAAAGLCGAGMLPLAVVPFAIFAARRRFR